MVFFKWSGCAGLALLLVAAGPALAEPTTLICTGADVQRGTTLPINIDLDEPASAVTINYPAHTDASTTPPTPIAATSDGPLDAIFDPKTVVFNMQKPGSGATVMRYSHYTLDRLTGALIQYDSNNAPFDQADPKDKSIYHYSCHLAKAQF